MTIMELVKEAKVDPDKWKAKMGNWKQISEAWKEYAEQDILEMIACELEFRNRLDILLKLVTRYQTLRNKRERGEFFHCLSQN